MSILIEVQLLFSVKIKYVQYPVEILVLLSNNLLKQTLFLARVDLQNAIKLVPPQGINIILNFFFLYNKEKQLWYLLKKQPNCKRNTAYAKMASMKKVMKYRWQPRNGCHGRSVTKILITTIQVSLCYNSWAPELLSKFLLLTYHDSHFLPATSIFLIFFHTSHFAYLGYFWVNYILGNYCMSALKIIYTFR